MTKYTAGPWNLQEFTGRDSRGWFVTIPGQNTRIDVDDYSDESRGNACLIAAAPEMLEALERAVSEHEARFGECNCGICEPAKAAIRKATGESNA